MGVSIPLDTRASLVVALLPILSQLRLPMYQPAQSASRPFSMGWKLLLIIVIVCFTVGLFGRYAWVQHKVESATRAALPETITKMTADHPPVGATGNWLETTWKPLSHKTTLNIRFQDKALRFEVDLANLPACAITLNYFKKHLDQAARINLLVNQLPAQSAADFASLSCVAKPGAKPASAAQVFTFGPVAMKH